MSIEEIKPEVLRFFLTNEVKVLILKGPWGVGKTHFWRDIINDPSLNTVIEDYSYVSLFGLNSIKDLQRALYENCISLKQTGENELTNRYQKLINGTKMIFNKGGGPLLKAASKIIGDVTPVYESLMFSLVKNAVICLDDLERIGKDFTIKEIFGLVSKLREERNCKIVLIFNEDSLDSNQKGDYERYKEKIIDKELLFNPTYDENLQYVFNEKKYSHVSEKSKLLKLKNIRILYKIKLFFDRFLEILNAGKNNSEFLKHISEKIVLYVWLYYDHENNSGIKIRDIHGILDGRNIFDNTEEERGKEEVKAQKLIDLGFSSIDELKFPVFQKT